MLYADPGSGVLIWQLLLALFFLRDSGTVVSNLQPGERLYVSGLQVEPSQVELDSRQPQVVATGC